MQTEIDPRDLIGHKAVDKNGEKIGTVDEVYLDDATGEPEWAAVRTGLFGRDAFVPLTTSEFVSEELRVPYEKSQVKDSPDFGVGQHLSPAQELQLYRYYGLEVPTGTGQHAADSGAKAAEGNGHGPTSAPKAGEAAAAAGAAGVAAGAATRGERKENLTKEEQPVEKTVATPVVESQSNGGRTSAFMTGGTTAGAQAGQTAQTAQMPRVGQDAAQDSTMQQPTVQTPPAAPFPSSGMAGAGAGAGAMGGTATEPQRRPDPLTDPLPGFGAPATSGTATAGTATPGTTGAATGTVAKEPVPEPVEFVCREERLDISTEWHVLGRARLRKYVTAEQVERRVPVVRERIRVERVPVSAEEREQLTEAEIAESVEEVTLHEERLVVKKTVVPVERIRLVTERITEEEVVREQLHREHIQVQDGSRPQGTPVAPATTPPAAGAPIGGAPIAGTPAATPLRPNGPTSPNGPMGQNPDLPGHAMGA
ncbi:uncharacterized protein (TIGR02271 family) [Streptacidiphilus sp. BW17]|uniref:PRC and DUF2382 domain-containing protein n=1 Tax=Streptacidiphilus sp. BW17 TaxID=3156274 RepID=UPI0035170F49